MKASQTLAFAAALVFWGIFFYLMNLFIMESQGLPVAWTLMPK